MRKLFDAGMRVFAERGYHAARVDDIVRTARTSHGTFYLYFANKEDLLRALAVDCADDLAKLADRIGPITPDEQGFGELRAFLAEFVATYRRYGPVIRAWMEDQVADPEIDRLGVKAFTAIGARLGQRMREVGAGIVDNEIAAAGALMAMLERFNYALGVTAPDPRGRRRARHARPHHPPRFLRRPGALETDSTRLVLIGPADRAGT